MAGSSRAVGSCNAPACETVRVKFVVFRAGIMAHRDRNSDQTRIVAQGALQTDLGLEPVTPGSALNSFLGRMPRGSRWESMRARNHCGLLIICAAQYNEFAPTRELRASEAPRGSWSQRDRTQDGRRPMAGNFEDLQKMSQTNIDMTMKSFATMSKTAQAIAAEIADYSKRSFENGSKAIEQFLGVKSLDKAIELQGDFAKAAYEDYTAQATKFGALYADLFKEAFKPFGGHAVAKTSSAR